MTTETGQGQKRTSSRFVGIRVTAALQTRYDSPQDSLKFKLANYQFDSKPESIHSGNSFQKPKAFEQFDLLCKFRSTHF